VGGIVQTGDRGHTGHQRQMVCSSLGLGAAQIVSPCLKRMELFSSPLVPSYNLPVPADSWSAASPLQSQSTQLNTTSSASLELVSASATGGRLGSISDDGQFIAFQAGSDVYVRDRTSNTTRLVSINSSGTGSGNGTSFDPIISGNGRYVAFTSTANDLVLEMPETSNLTRDVFVRDLLTDTTALVSINSAGTASGSGDSGSHQNFSQLSQQVAISQDGRYIAFSSAANDLAINDTDSAPYSWLRDVFLRDTLTGSTTLLSDFGQTPVGNASYDNPVISADGQQIAFTQSGWGGSNTGNLFMANVQTGTTVAAGVNVAIETATGQARPVTISADGGTVVFVSSHLNSSYTSDLLNVYAWNYTTGNTTLVSVNATGTGGGNAHSGQAPSSNATNFAVSADGRYITFTSVASNLVNHDFNQSADVFVRDLQTNTTTLLSGGFPTPPMEDPAISADGRYITFTMKSGGYGSGYGEVYVYDQVEAIATLISRTATGAWSGAASNAMISRDGRYIAFESLSSLLAADTNGTLDVYGFSTSQLQPEQAVT
jgi:hypothetical protein